MQTGETCGIIKVRKALLEQSHEFKIKARRDGKKQQHLPLCRQGCLQGMSKVDKEASDSGWQVRLIDQRARNHEEEWGECGLGKKTARLKKNYILERKENQETVTQKTQVYLKFIEDKRKVDGEKSRSYWRR